MSGEEEEDEEVELVMPGSTAPRKVSRKIVDGVLVREVGLSIAQLVALEVLAAGRSVAEAAHRAKVHAGSVYRWMRHDPGFVAQFELLK